MSELRKDPVLNRWILIGGSADPKDGEQCPVCARIGELAGAARTGAVIASQPVLDRRSVVDRSRSGGDLYTTMTGSGENELLIEAREHGTSLADLPIDHLTEILQLYRERLLFFRQDDRFRFMTIIKNQASIDHVCSEAFALPMVPPYIKEKIAGMQGYARRTGSCVYCDMIKVERAEKTRRVAETMRHVAIAPFASKTPFELLLLPRGHHSDYALSSDQDLSDLAALFSECLRRVDRVLDGAKTRIVLHTAPPEMGADLQQFHWHFEIHPVARARAPLWSIVDLNPTPPEEAARLLREAQL